MVTAIVKPVLTLLSIPLVSSRSGCSWWSSTPFMLQLTAWLAEQLDIGFHVDGF